MPEEAGSLWQVRTVMATSTGGRGQAPARRNRDGPGQADYRIEEEHVIPSVAALQPRQKMRQ
jgi:hypothetical protein